MFDHNRTFPCAARDLFMYCARPPESQCPRWWHRSSSSSSSRAEKARAHTLSHNNFQLTHMLTLLPSHDDGGDVGCFGVRRPRLILGLSGRSRTFDLRMNAAHTHTHMHHNFFHCLETQVVFCVAARRTRAICALGVCVCVRLAIHSSCALDG